MLLLHSALQGALGTSVIYLSLLIVQVWVPLELSLWTWAVLSVVAFLLATLWAFMRTPTLLDLAKLADRRFALQERISTTLELAGSARAGIEGEVDSALVLDTAHYVERIEPEKLVPFRFPREAWFVLALLVVTIAAQVWLPERELEQVQSVAQLSEPFHEDERSDAATRLHRVSELVSREAEEREDAYLQALARAFDELGDRVEAGELNRLAYETELSRLMEHIERIYEGEASPLADALSPPPTAAPETQALSDEGVEGESLSEEAPQASSERGDNSSAELEAFLHHLEADLQQANAEREANSGRVSRSDVREFGPYVTPEMVEFLRRQQEMREEQQVQGAGQPIGAAQEADKGPGDLAGEGVQPLAEGQDNGAFERVSAELEEVLLPDGQVATDDHIQLELPPQAQLSEVADDLAPTPRDWQVGREVELRRDLLGPRDRSVVSRYFEREELEAQAAP